MDFSALAYKIELATKAAFREIHSQYGSEEIYAFALYSDDGAETVCPTSNTLEYLHHHSDETCLEDKYDSAEWRYEMVGAEQLFDDVYTELEALHQHVRQHDNEDAAEQAFCDFRNQLFETCYNVLLKLKQENFFSNITGKDIFLMFTVSDSDFTDSERHKEMIKALNDNAYRDEYLAWRA